MTMNKDKYRLEIKNLGNHTIHLGGNRWKIVNKQGYGWKDIQIENRKYTRDDLAQFSKLGWVLS